MGRFTKQTKGCTLFTKKQKKLLSHVMRNYVSSKGKRNLESIYGRWHSVRCPFDDEMTCDYGLFNCVNYRDAVNWCHEMKCESYANLPSFDGSGLPFISHYHVGRTSDPHMFAIVLYWSLDI